MALKNYQKNHVQALLQTFRFSWIFSPIDLLVNGRILHLTCHLIHTSKDCSTNSFTSILDLLQYGSLDKFVPIFYFELFLVNISLKPLSIHLWIGCSLASIIVLLKQVHFSIHHNQEHFLNSHHHIHWLLIGIQIIFLTHSHIQLRIKGRKLSFGTSNWCDETPNLPRFHLHFSPHKKTQNRFINGNSHW
jgi:hypothetical protein